MNQKKWLVCAVVGAAGVFSSLIGASAVAAPIITVGDHELLSNTPGQIVLIFVSGGDPVQGLNFNAQVADGGGEAGGSIDGPNITAANIVSGTIFTGKNTGQQDPGSVPQVAVRTTTTNSGTVAAEGLLATLTIDTTGFTTGSWDLKVAGTANGDTDFSGVPATITNGTISILVPEPGTLTALALVVAPLVLGRRGRGNCRR